MFEVGKKYYPKGHRDNLYECVAVNNSQQGWMRRVGISERCVTFDWDQGWVEHKEPRRAERWVNVYEVPEGYLNFSGFYLSKEIALQSKNFRDSRTYVDTIKIEYTEKV